MLQLKKHQIYHFLPQVGVKSLWFSPVVSDDDELIQEIDQQNQANDDNWTLDSMPDVNGVEQFWTDVQTDLHKDPDWYTFSDD